MLIIRPVVTTLAFVALSGCCRLPSSTDSKDPAPTKTSTSSGSQRIFTMDFPCNTDPGLRIKQVVMTPTETRISVRFQNRENRTSEISTAPPGSAETFFIEAADQTRTLELRSSSGIAVSPNKNRVPPHGTVDFWLIFPPIDESWSPIDLHEGKVYKKGTNFWNFEDVPLR